MGTWSRWSRLTETTLTETVVEVMAELAELEDSKTRAVNEKHGDNHGVNLSKVNLSKLRAREAAEDAAGTRVPALGAG